MGHQTNLRTQAALLNAKALAIGGAGALAAHALHLPLPWLLGSMFATGVMALFQIRMVVYRPMRMGFLTVIGVLLGSSFTPQFLTGLGGNLVTMTFLIPYTVLGTILVYVILQKTTTLDRPTAFFSSVPGGVNEMILLGAERGGHEPTLAVHQSLRLLLVIFTVTMIFAALGHVGGSSAPAPRSGDNSPAALLSILAMAAAGAVIARRIGMPAPFILGPMAVSALLHLTGMTDVKPDFLLIAVAQVISGAAVGAQFSTFSRRTLMSAGATAVAIGALLLVFTVAFAWMMSLIVDRPFFVLLLAFAPGGLAEMGLIALAMNADAAFVSATQVFRFVVVVTTAAPLFRMLGRLGNHGER